MKIEPNDGLIVVDVQNTFCPGGTLPVPEGDAVVEPLNRIMPKFQGRIWATQDWHPDGHCSFTAQGGPWPPHAVKDTADAELHPALDQSKIDHIVQKGTQSDRESYSGFDGTGLADRLRNAGINRVFVGGLATDYCVKATALDARAAGFDVVVLTDACRPVDVNPGDGAQALREMEDTGCTLTTTAAL